MKQLIGTMKDPSEPVDDLDVLFVAVYNLLYEKIQQEPKKGIVVSKGNPNQRKATWKEIMKIAHEMEDYFMFRKLRTGCDICGKCKNFQSTSDVSPYKGQCKARGLTLVHAWGSCQRHFERRDS